MNCNICNATSLIHIGHVEGYRAGTRFSVFECGNCNTSVVDPCQSDQKLYDAIYDNVARVPGYARYHSLANELLRASNPLQYIGNVEDSYYAVRKTLNQRVLDKARTTICEVGCGQGYLTYSLVKSGFNCTGVDISSSAVALAKQRYGNHYFCGSVSEFCAGRAKPDIIVATELIEHLEDPTRFVSSMLDALTDEGILIVTTPNKSLHTQQIWDTELPPVHLWWFAKNGLIAIARANDCNVTFVDFTDFYKAHPDYELSSSHKKIARSPVFDQDYELSSTLSPQNPTSTRARIKRMLPGKVVQRIQRLRAGKSYGVAIGDSNSHSIGAIFTKAPPMRKANVKSAT